LRPSHEAATEQEGQEETDETLDDYLDLPYTIVIQHDRDDDGNEGYVARVAELPGAISQGATIEEAAPPGRQCPPLTAAPAFA
jgi:hypothetical protein